MSVRARPGVEDSVVDVSETAAPPAAPGMLSLSSRHAALGAAVALAAAGLFFSWQASLLDFGSVGLPGPGFFPFVLGLFLTAFASVTAFVVARDRTEGEPVELGHRDVLIGIAALIGVCVGFEPVGAFLTLGVFAAALLVLVGRVSVLTAALSSLVGMIAVWYFFKVLLGLQLPDGVLDIDAASSFLKSLFQ